MSDNTNNIETKIEVDPKEVEGEPITKFVKQDVANSLIEMGFSKNVAEKACFLNGNSLEKAMEWIESHQNDPDFEEELRIIKQEGEVPTTNLTPEEAKRKAKELQEYARKVHLEKQRQLEEEQERNRVRTTKELLKAKREMEEAEMRRFVETEKLRKKEEEIAKRKMLEQLARDKEERFGKKFDPVSQGEKKEYTKLENVQYYLKAIKTLYPPFRNGDLTKNCYSTLKVVISNIVKNPNEEKFRKVKVTNPNFNERVGKINLAMKVLGEWGFVEDGEFLVVSNPDLDLYNKSIQFLEEEIGKL